MTAKRRPSLATRTGPKRGYVVSHRGLETVEKMARGGMETATIAAALGMSTSAFRQVMHRQVEVEQAMARGRAGLSDELMNLLLKSARKGNVVAAIFLAKARCGWREGDPPETRPNITIVLPDAATPEQYMKTISAAAPARAAPLPLLDFLKVERKP
jgi:hypothetical protein